MYCSTESLDLRALEARIRDQHSTWQLLQLPDEVLHVMLPGLSMQLLQDQATAAVRKRGRSASSYQSALMHDAAATSSGARDRSSGSVSVLVQDIFFFGYGVTCFWGFSADLEQLLMKELVAPCQVSPWIIGFRRAVKKFMHLAAYATSWLDYRTDLQVGAYPAKEVDVDEFTFCYAGHATPNMQNDTITISRRQAADHQVRPAAQPPPSFPGCMHPCGLRMSASSPMDFILQAAL